MNYNTVYVGIKDAEVDNPVEFIDVEVGNVCKDNLSRAAVEILAYKIFLCGAKMAVRSLFLLSLVFWRVSIHGGELHFVHYPSAADNAHVYLVVTQHMYIKRTASRHEAQLFYDLKKAFFDLHILLLQHEQSAVFLLRIAPPAI